MSKPGAAMKRRFFLPALLAAVVLGACGPPANVSSPISEPGLASYDERLVGTWYIIGRHVPGETATLTAAPGKDGILDVAGDILCTQMCHI